MFWWFPVGGKGRTLADLQLFRLTEHRSIGPDFRLHKPPWFCVPVLRVVSSRRRGQGPCRATILSLGVLQHLARRRRRLNRYGSALLV